MLAQGVACLLWWCSIHFMNPKRYNTTCNRLHTATFNLFFSVVLSCTDTSPWNYLHGSPCALYLARRCHGWSTSSSLHQVLGGIVLTCLVHLGSPSSWFFPELAAQPQLFCHVTTSWDSHANFATMRFPPRRRATSDSSPWLFSCIAVLVQLSATMVRRLLHAS